MWDCYKPSTVALLIRSSLNSCFPLQIGRVSVDISGNQVGALSTLVGAAHLHYIADDCVEESDLFRVLYC